MKMHVDAAYQASTNMGKSFAAIRLRSYERPDSTIAVLADGLGSGVKANILSTLSSTIVSTMLHEGSTIAEVVETIAKTLPVCSVRKLAYSTFSVLQIFDDGTAHLVEFDNPPCIFVRNGKVMDLESRSEVEGVRRQANFRVYLFCAAGRRPCVGQRRRDLCRRGPGFEFWLELGQCIVLVGQDDFEGKFCAPFGGFPFGGRARTVSRQAGR